MQLQARPPWQPAKGRAKATPLPPLPLPTSRQESRASGGCQVQCRETIEKAVARYEKCPNGEVDVKVMESSLEEGAPEREPEGEGS